MIDCPAHGRPNQDAGNQLGREPKTARDRRGIGGRTLTWVTFGGTVGMELAEPFTETLEPCGERRLVSRWVFAITSFACVVGHAFDTRDGRGNHGSSAAPRRADHTDWV